MTDKEIIKALECCKNDDCDNCPNTFGNCYANLAGYALDLINRQVARNEQLRDDLQKHMDAEEYLAKLTDEQQAEIERLKRKLAMAKEGLKHTCITCFYMETPSQETPCRDCRSFNKWKWRGDEDDSE